LPTDRGKLWELLVNLINEWWEPLKPEHGCTEEEIRAAEERLGVRLPAAMREFYGLFGRYSKYHSPLREPENLEIEATGSIDGDLLELTYVLPMQMPVYILARDLALPDPPIRVFGHLPPEGAETLSLFCAQEFVSKLARDNEGINGLRCFAEGDTTEVEAAWRRLSDRFCPSGLPPYKLVGEPRPDGESRFYVYRAFFGKGLVIHGEVQADTSRFITVRVWAADEKTAERTVAELGLDLWRTGP
jgi:hypothetical protein